MIIEPNDVIDSTKIQIPTKPTLKTYFFPVVVVVVWLILKNANNLHKCVAFFSYLTVIDDKTLKTFLMIVSGRNAFFFFL